VRIQRFEFVEECSIHQSGKPMEFWEDSNECIQMSNQEFELIQTQMAQKPVLRVRCANNASAE